MALFFGTNATEADRRGIVSTAAVSAGITTGPFTFAWWYNPLQVPTGANGRIWYDSNTVSIVRVVTTGVMRWSDGSLRDWSPTLASHQWYHLAITRNASDVMNLFVDGVEQTTNYASVTANIADGANWSIGGRLDGQQPSQADIAELAIWTAALETNECTALAAGFSPENVRRGSLISYLPLHATNTLFDAYLGIQYSNSTANIPTVAEHPRSIYPFGGNQQLTFTTPPVNVSLFGIG